MGQSAYRRSEGEKDETRQEKEKERKRYTGRDTASVCYVAFTWLLRNAARLAPSFARVSRFSTRDINWFISSIQWESLPHLPFQIIKGCEARLATGWKGSLAKTAFHRETADFSKKPIERISFPRRFITGLKNVRLRSDTEGEGKERGRGLHAQSNKHRVRMKTHQAVMFASLLSRDGVAYRLFNQCLCLPPSFIVGTFLLFAAPRCCIAPHA